VSLALGLRPRARRVGARGRRPVPPAGAYRRAGRRRRRLDEVPNEAERLRGELAAALAAGRAHELVPFSGQTAGLIHEVLPAGEIVRRLVVEAEEALAGLVSAM
jgi:NAD(P)H-dependent flavin oxidoreductase YrpB (nitropropane dioxygenase family)